MTTASFTATQLSGHRALVRGTDSQNYVGETVVSTLQWEEVKATRLFKEAEAKYDQTVHAFFAPVTDAADELTKALEGSTVEDPAFTILLEEGTEGVDAKPEHRLTLDKDSVILRLIEDSQFDRLVWVGQDLEVLAPVAPAQP